MEKARRSLCEGKYTVLKIQSNILFDEINIVGGGKKWGFILNELFLTTPQFWGTLFLYPLQITPQMRLCKFICREICPSSTNKEGREQSFSETYCTCHPTGPSVGRCHYLSIQHWKTSLEIGQILLLFQRYLIIWAITVLAKSSVSYIYEIWASKSPQKILFYCQICRRGGTQIQKLHMKIWAKSDI